MILSLNDLALKSENFHSSILLKNGEALTLRPLLVSDEDKLTTFLQNLAPETRRLSTFPSYDQITAKEMCGAIDRYDKLRFVLESPLQVIVGLFEFSFSIPEGDLARFKKYGIDLSATSDCRFGPTLADEYQDKGIGSQAFPFLMEIAKQFGKERVILFGGVLADNLRAIHFYKKNGFMEVGTFENTEGLKCVDMLKNQ